MEHFIRAGNFETGAEDFGFLVPTPSVPTLAEVDPGLFPTLDRLTRPQHRSEARYVPGCIGTMFFSGDAKDMASAPLAVEVLHEQRVGRYDATVLKAADADALSAWLDERGYARRPALLAWLRIYVDQGWVITAFKVAKDERETDRVSSAAVRMSFETDRPFYPYREPSDQREGARGPRTLVVDFLSTERVEAVIGDGTHVFPGSTPFSRDLGESAEDIVGRLAVDARPAVTWLTRFVDSRSPRQGVDELYFSPSQDPSEVVPPAIVDTDEVMLPLEPAFLLLVGLLWWRRRRRRDG